MIIIFVEFILLGINIYVFGPNLRVHFNTCLAARAKMSLSRALNIFMLPNINSMGRLFKRSLTSV